MRWRAERSRSSRSSLLLLKGKADPVAAYRVVRVIEGAAAFERRDDAPFVGRRQELAAVRAAFDGAIAERALPACHGARAAGHRQVAARQRAHRRRSPSARRSSPAAAFPTARASPTGRSRRSFARAMPRTSSRRACGRGSEEIFWSVRKAFERRARERPLGARRRGHPLGRADAPRPARAPRRTGRAMRRSFSSASRGPSCGRPAGVGAAARSRDGHARAAVGGPSPTR